MEENTEIRLKRYEINSKEIWLASKKTLTKLLGINSRLWWDYETKGFIPKSIFRYASRGYNVVTREIGTLYKQLYTKEHVILLSTWYAATSAMSKTHFKPTAKQIALLHNEWELIDNAIIEEYGLDARSTTHVAREKLPEGKKYKEPETTWAKE